MFDLLGEIYKNQEECIMLNKVMSLGNTLLTQSYSVFEGPFGLKEVFTIACVLVALAELAIFIWVIAESFKR